MPRTRTVVVTGSASGMGAATRTLLEQAGQRVIGVDLRDADIVADLATPGGREQVIEGVAKLADGVIDGVVTWAGLTGLTSVAGSDLVSVNYFGTVALLAGLRPLLARGDLPAAVAISSNSTTCMPAVPMEVTERCLAGDEEGARSAADSAGSIRSYPASKLAVARWVRRNAPSGDWAGSGITLNAIAPGTVQTPMLDAARKDPVIGEFIDAFPVPTGSAARPEQLASFAAFLLGPGARYCCGSVFFVDGGTDALLRADDFPAPMSPG
jgi:NAD(P)-dependent dehydrogenase (short-subunit alcohol dehydrogenase family)